VLILKNDCYAIITLMLADFLFELKYRKSAEIVMHELVFSPCEIIFLILIVLLFQCNYLIYDAQNTLILYIR